MPDTDVLPHPAISVPSGEMATELTPKDDDVLRDFVSVPYAMDHKPRKPPTGVLPFAL